MELKIIFTSDIHGYIYPTDYLDREYKETGLLSLAGKYDKDENTLILDGGDTLQGSAFDYYLQKENGANILADIMNQVGVDYYTLGNHDFNFGYDYLKDYVKNMEGVLLCANVEDKTDTLPIEKFAIRTMGNGLKVGITGIVTNWVNIWEKKENLDNFIITDPFIAARDVLGEMNGCDIKICIYHGGYEVDLETGESTSLSDENIGGKIAKELSFDLLLTGHQHRPMAGMKLFNSYTIQTPPNGEKFGLIKVEKNDDGITFESSLVEGARPLQKTMEKYRAINDKVQDFLDGSIATISKDYIPKDRLEMAINGWDLADLFNRVQIEYTGADISLVSFANEISGIRKNVTIRDILNTYRFPNSLAVLEIDGKSLRLALEQNYTYIDWEQGEYKISQNFLEPKKEHYNFDFFYGLDFEIDLQKPKYQRIGKIIFEGKEIDDNHLLKLVMNNYRALGAGNFPMYTKLKTVKLLDREMTDILIEYFENIEKNRVSGK